MRIVAAGIGVLAICALALAPSLVKASADVSGSYVGTLEMQG